MGIGLLSVQEGDMPKDFKPMPSVGKGVYEIRVNLGGAWRALYVAKFTEAVYVLHVFRRRPNGLLRKTSRLQGSVIERWRMSDEAKGCPSERDEENEELREYFYRPRLRTSRGKGHACSC
jgi:phage-related protein